MKLILSSSKPHPFAGESLLVIPSRIHLRIQTHSASTSLEAAAHIKPQISQHPPYPSQPATLMVEFRVIRAEGKVQLHVKSSIVDCIGDLPPIIARPTEDVIKEVMAEMLVRQRRNASETFTVDEPTGKLRSHVFVASISQDLPCTQRIYNSPAWGGNEPYAKSRNEPFHHSIPAQLCWYCTTHTFWNDGALQHTLRIN